MDFYRAPTAVGRPSVQSSSLTMPLSRPGSISDASPSSNAIFNETFTQLQAPNGVLPQQQLQKSNSQHQQIQVSVTIILQQIVKKNGKCFVLLHNLFYYHFFIRTVHCCINSAGKACSYFK